MSRVHLRSEHAYGESFCPLEKVGAQSFLKRPLLSAVGWRQLAIGDWIDCRGCNDC